jgi:cysteine desulfurase
MSYFDHNATTPLHPEVAEAMAECIRASQTAEYGLPSATTYGNPSSIHSLGRKARSLVEDAREHLAKLLAVSPSEIVFTSGGTEANNLAIQGATASGKLPGRHLITTSFEHPSVLEVFRKLETEGWEVTWLQPDSHGQISVQSVENALRPDSGLVSIMVANNEVGTVQPMRALGHLLHARGIAFHSDGVQALGKLVETDPRQWQVDFLSLSAHKLNGPKGVGALYVRKGAPILGQILGGPQERNFRGGTENVLGIVGFGKAVEISLRQSRFEYSRLQLLRDALAVALSAKFPNLILNGGDVDRLPNTLNVTLPGCRSDLMVMGLDMRGVAVSAGSACASGSVKYSHVLLAMGKSKEVAACSLRFSFGLGNRTEDIAPLVLAVAEVAASVRGL